MKAKVLLCVNEKEKTNNMVKLAAEHAIKQNAKLIILTIVDIEEIREMIYEKIIDEYKESIKSRLNSIAKFIKRKFPDLDVETELTEGLIVDSILEFVKNHRTELKYIFFGGSSKKGSCIYSLIPNIVELSDALIIISHKTR